MLRARLWFPDTVIATLRWRRATAHFATLSKLTSHRLTIVAAGRK
jgi:hypothetical protein